jgi:hypothetical protein
VHDIGADRLHILIAARNPGSMALSTWQQTLRNGHSRELETWLADSYRRESPTRADSGFWSWADSASLVEDWSDLLGLERITVVAIDETDRALLPTAFERLLALPAGTLSGREAPRNNRSLTAAEAELLRQAINLTRDKLRWEEYSQFFRTGYATRLLSTRVPPAGEARQVLPAWAVAQAEVEADDMIRRLRATGVRVLGDLDSLRRIPVTAEPTPVDHVPVELAAEGIAGVVLAATQRMRKTEARIEELTAAASGRPRSVEEIPTRELAAMLRTRIRAGIKRRIKAPRAGHRTPR